MPVITLSRQIGAGGEAIAMQVAGRLRLRLMDREFLTRIAVSAGLTEDALLELEAEGQRNLVGRILASLRTVAATPEESGEQDEEDGQQALLRYPNLSLNPLAGIFSPVMPPASIGLSESVQLLGKVVQHLADEGDVLLVGDGAQAWLKSRPDVFHVLVIAPYERRCNWVQNRLRISPKEAQRQVRISDRARAAYMRRYHGTDWLDPRLYDLAINTGRISESLAVELISRTASQTELAEGLTPHLSGGDIPLSIPSEEHNEYDIASLQHPDATEGTA